MGRTNVAESINFVDDRVGAPQGVNGLPGYLDQRLNRLSTFSHDALADLLVRGRDRPAGAC